VPNSEIRLVDWPEANYYNRDKPNPRGEIYIGGGSVTLGYYNMPEKTAEDYKTINGIRYFATGDIGEFLPNGSLKIIDRKKDLVKLSGGEYVSLNKIENIIKLLPYVDNCCVVADPLKPNCVCLITPNKPKMIEMMPSIFGDGGGDDVEANGANTKRRFSDDLLNEIFVKLNQNPSYMEKFNKEIIEHCQSHRLERFEIPTKSRFVKEVWLPDSGLVTDSLKLKRKEIEKFYKKDIEQLFAQQTAN
jgi:long-chain acyl-CoA synthetase